MSVQAYSQKLNKEEAISPPLTVPSFFSSLPFSLPFLFPSLPYPSPLLSSPLRSRGRYIYRGFRGALKLRSAGLGGARPPNASGLSKTRLLKTYLILLCDRVTHSITSHITRTGTFLLVPQRSYTALLFDFYGVPSLWERRSHRNDHCAAVIWTVYYSH